MSWMDCVMAASSGLPSTRQCTASRMISGGSAGVMMMMALPCLAPPTFSTVPPHGAVPGVAYDRGGRGGVDDDDGLPLPAAAAFPAGARRGARELVDVL